MLDNVNLLYLSCRVLILLDNAYLARFWTQFEAWVSMQTACSEGLIPSTEAQQRYCISPIHNGDATLAKVLKNIWHDKTCEDAYKVLSHVDVAVTNQSDKDTILPKVVTLNDTIKTAFASLASEASGSASKHSMRSSASAPTPAVVQGVPVLSQQPSPPLFIPRMSVPVVSPQSQMAASQPQVAQQPVTVQQQPVPMMQQQPGMPMRVPATAAQPTAVSPPQSGLVSGAMNFVRSLFGGRPRQAAVHPMPQAQLTRSRTTITEC